MVTSEKALAVDLCTSPAPAVTHAATLHKWVSALSVCVYCVCCALCASFFFFLNAYLNLSQHRSLASMPIGLPYARTAYYTLSLIYLHCIRKRIGSSKAGWPAGGHAIVHFFLKCGRHRWLVPVVLVHFHSNTSYYLQTTKWNSSYAKWILCKGNSEQRKHITSLEVCVLCAVCCVCVCVDREIQIDRETVTIIIIIIAVVIGAACPAHRPT